MRVKVITASMMDVQNGKVAPLEDQINDFIQGVIPIHFSYSVIPGYQGCLIGYEAKPAPRHETTGGDYTISAQGQGTVK